MLITSAPWSVHQTIAFETRVVGVPPVAAKTLAIIRLALGATPAITTAGTLNTPWLRSPNGVCTGGKSGDPAARATFGVFSSETQRIIHVREAYN